VDLIQRRLNTLIKLLRTEAREVRARDSDTELVAKEMLEWAAQCEQIADARNPPIDPLLR
jgi:hypothetical protein